MRAGREPTAAALRSSSRSATALAARYHEQLEGTPGLTSLPAAGRGRARSTATTCSSCASMKDRSAARFVADPALRAAGIGTQLHYIPIYHHSLTPGGSASVPRPRRAARTPSAITRTALSLPMYPDLADCPTSSGWSRSCARRCREGRAAPRGVGAAARARKARHPRLHADALQEPHAVGAGRCAGLRLARRGRACLGCRRKPVSRLPDGAGPDHPRVRPSRGERGDRAPAAGRDRLHSPAPGRGRGGRADRRARAVRGSRPVREDRLRCDDGVGAPRAGLHRPGRRHRVRLSRLAGLVHRRRPRGDLGVPEAVRALSDSVLLNDLGALDAAARTAGRRRSAAVILEPVGAEEPEEGFLQGVLDRAHAAGALVVFDEIITGFRLALGRRAGAVRRRRRTWPPSARRSGNGMPISALVGKAEYMDRLEDVFFSGTHGGEALSLAAANAVLDELTPALYEALVLARRAAAQRRPGRDRRGRRRRRARRVDRRRGAEDGDDRSRAGEPGATARAKHRRAGLEVKRGVLFNGSNFICAPTPTRTSTTPSSPIARRSELRRPADGRPGSCARRLTGPARLPRALMAATKVGFRRCLVRDRRTAGRRRRTRVRDRRGRRRHNRALGMAKQLIDVAADRARTL